MKERTRFSVSKRIKSFYHAFNGLRFMFLYEHNSRIHLAVLLGVLALGIYFKIEFSVWAIIAIVAGMVIISELFNSAIEQLADIVNPEWDKKIGFVKDYAAGAVLISTAVSIIAGFIIFFPRIWELLKSTFS